MTYRERCADCGVVHGRPHLEGCSRREADQERWIARAREGYATGDLTLEELEASVAHALAGLEVGPDGRIPSPRNWNGHTPINDYQTFDLT